MSYWTSFGEVVIVGGAGNEGGDGAGVGGGAVFDDGAWPAILDVLGLAPAANSPANGVNPMTAPVVVLENLVPAGVVRGDDDGVLDNLLIDGGSLVGNVV